MAAPRTSPHRLGEVKLRAETTAGESIADPVTYWANASAKQYKAWELDISNLKKGSEVDPAMQTTPFAAPPNILNVKAPCSISWMQRLIGLGNSTPAQDNLGLLLVTALGGESLGGAATTVDPANTGAGATVALKVVSAANIVAGQAILVQISGEWYARKVVSKSSNDLTLDQDLPSVPSSGATVRESATYYYDRSALTDLSDSGHDTFAVLARFYDSEDRWQMRGGTPQLELVDLGMPGTFPKLKVTMHGMDFDEPDYSSSSALANVAVGASFSETNPTAQRNSGLYCDPAGTVVVNPRHTKSVSVRLGLVPQPQVSPSGQQGVIGHYFDGARVELEFELLNYDDEWRARYYTQTAHYAGLQLGAGLLLTFGQLYIDEMPERIGSAGSPTGVRVKMHSDLGSVVTNELTESPLAIHRFG